MPLPRASNLGVIAAPRNKPLVYEGVVVEGVKLATMRGEIDGKADKADT